MSKVTEIPRSFIRGDTVYLLYEGDEIVYVGKSRSGLMRLITHDASDKKFTNIRIIEPVEPFSIDDLEQSLIRVYQPKLNTMLFKDRPFYSSRRVIDHCAGDDLHDQFKAQWGNFEKDVKKHCALYLDSQDEEYDSELRGLAQKIYASRAPVDWVLKQDCLHIHLHLDMFTLNELLHLSDYDDKAAQEQGFGGVSAYLTWNEMLVQTDLPKLFLLWSSGLVGDHLHNDYVSIAFDEAGFKKIMSYAWAMGLWGKAEKNLDEIRAGSTNVS